MTLANLLRVAYILFIGIFLAPIVFFVLNTYGDDTSGSGWYQDLWNKKDILSTVLAFALFPVYFLASKILQLFYESWEKMGE